MPSTKALEEELIKYLQKFTEKDNKKRAIDLIEQGVVDVNFSNLSDKGTALHEVFSCLNKLKKQKMNLDNYEDDAIEIIKSLIKHGIDPNKIDHRKFANAHPLHFAISLFRPAIVELLLEAGANPYALSNWQKQPSNVREDIEERLLEAGINPQSLRNWQKWPQELNLPNAIRAIDAVEIYLSQNKNKKKELTAIKKLLEHYSKISSKIPQLQKQLTEQQELTTLQQKRIEELEKSNKWTLPEFSMGFATASTILGVAFLVYPFEEAPALRLVGLIPLCLGAYSGTNNFQKEYERSISFFGTTVVPVITNNIDQISKGLFEYLKNGGMKTPFIGAWIHDNAIMQPYAITDNGNRNGIQPYAITNNGNGNVGMHREAITGNGNGNVGMHSHAITDNGNGNGMQPHAVTNNGNGNKGMSCTIL